MEGNGQSGWTSLLNPLLSSYDNLLFAAPITIIRFSSYFFVGSHLHIVAFSLSQPSDRFADSPVAFYVQRPSFRHIASHRVSDLITGNSANPFPGNLHASFGWGGHPG